MTESRSGLQKKVSSIFKGAPIPKAGEKPQLVIAPLLAANSRKQEANTQSVQAHSTNSVQAVVEQPADSTHPTSSGQTSSPQAKEEKGNGMSVNLIRFRKSGEQKVFALPSTVTVIGRRTSCDLRLPLAIVSKKHCQINFDDGALKIRDLGSRNGTLLNGIRVDEAAIQPGDCVQVGPIGFVFQVNGQPEKVIPPTLRKAEAPKPKKPKAAPKAEKKVEQKTAAKAQDENLDSLGASAISDILNGDTGLDKDVKSSSGTGDILIDDSELLSGGDDVKLDDLG